MPSPPPKSKLFIIWDANHFKVLQGSLPIFKSAKNKIVHILRARVVWGKCYTKAYRRFALPAPEKILGAKNLRLEPLS
jgi:hypothetical protein